MRNNTFVVNVPIAELIKKLKENREKHYENFETALVVYRKKVIEVLDEALEAARTGKEYKTYFNLVRPENMLDEYDEVIGMLEMSLGTTSSTIELTQDQYRNYVVDNWAWSGTFASNTLSYVGSSQ